MKRRCRNEERLDKDDEKTKKDDAETMNVRSGKTFTVSDSPAVALQGKEIIRL